MQPAGDWMRASRDKVSIVPLSTHVTDEDSQHIPLKQSNKCTQDKKYTTFENRQHF